MTRLAGQLSEQFHVPMRRFELIAAISSIYSGDAAGPWQHFPSIAAGVEFMKSVLENEENARGPFPPDDPATPAGATLAWDEAIRLVGGKDGIERLSGVGREQLPEEMARYFVADLDRYMRHTAGQAGRIVLFIDDYEALWPCKRMGQSPQSRGIDTWFRSLASFSLAAGILIVMTSREPLKWSLDYPEAGWDRDLVQRTLTGLDRAAAESLPGVLLPEANADRTYLPLHLKLAASQESAAKRPSLPEAGDEALSIILGRYLESIQRPAVFQRFLTDLAWAPRFDRKCVLAKDLQRDYLFGKSIWDDVLSLPFVESIGGGWYRYHPAVRDSFLRASQGKSVQEVNRWYDHYWISQNEPSLSLLHSWYAAPAEALEHWKQTLRNPGIRPAAARQLITYWTEADFGTAEAGIVGKDQWKAALIAVAEALIDFEKAGLTPLSVSNGLALHLLEQALQVMTEADGPEIWARAQRLAGIALRDIDAPDVVGSLSQAIGYIERALQVFTKAKHPYEWALTRLAMGDVKLAMAQQDTKETIQTALLQYEAALTVLNKDEHTRPWTEAQNSLGDAYLLLQEGDRDENLGRAATHFRAALSVLKPDTNPNEWARTITNLGTVLSEKSDGARSENLRKAKDCYEQALRVYREEGHPQEWATIQSNLAAMAAESASASEGAGDEGLALAVDHYRAALRVRTQRANPAAFALTQCNLGHTLRRMQGPQRATLTRLAINAYESALKVYTQNSTPETWARTHMFIAAAWQSMPMEESVVKPAFGKDPQVEFLQKAVHHAGLALRVFRESDHLEEWARAQYFLGNTYRQLPAGPAYENAVHASTCYVHALKYFTKDEHPMEWARIHLRCGQTLLDARDHAAAPSAGLVPEQDLEEAVEHLKRALEVYDEQRYPMEFALANLCLARACAAFAPPNRAQREGLLVDAAEHALRLMDRDDSPKEWGMLHQLLAEHFIEGGGRLRAENVARAAQHIEAAQLVLGDAPHPLARASIVELRARAALLGALDAPIAGNEGGEPEACDAAGASASNKETSERWRLLLQALGYFREAEQLVASAGVMPGGGESPQVAGTKGHSASALAGRCHQGFGFAKLLQSSLFGQWHEEKQAAAALEEAIGSFQLALKGLREVEDSYEWGRAQYNLGVALSRRLVDPVLSLRKAIEALSASLRVRSEQTTPVEWADCQHALGVCSAMLPAGVKGENARSAYICYKAALRVYTREHTPEKWARAQCNLGNIYARMPPGLRGEQVSEAIKHYVAALEVFTEKDYPGEWALLRNNIGAALVNMPVGGRANNLLRAVNCFESALRIRTEAHSHREWAMTQFNLGLAYRAMPAGENNENVRKAEECFELVAQSQLRKAPGKAGAAALSRKTT